MTQVEFIEELHKKGYSYEIEGDNIVVTDRNVHVGLSALTSLPPGVKFRNKGGIYLDALTSLPTPLISKLLTNMEFRNKGSVNLKSLIGGLFDDWKGNIEGIDSKRLLNVMIKQGVYVDLRAITSLSSG